jgi:hypothetical protein
LYNSSRLRPAYIFGIGGVTMAKIINIAEVIKTNIPELETINYKSENGRSYLSLKQWESRLKSIEHKNLKTYHKSLTWISIEKYFYPCIYERRMDDDCILINEFAYKLIRNFLTSKKFNLVSE